jgi:hypothetical protein
MQYSHTNTTTQGRGIPCSVKAVHWGLDLTMIAVTENTTPFVHDVVCLLHVDLT